jgi:uncharacterized protein (TIGR03437 family)
MNTYYLRRPLVYLFAFAASLFIIVFFATLRSQAVQSPKADDTPQTEAQQAEQSRKQRLQDLDTKMKTPGMLLFRAAEFDPLKALPATLRVGALRLEMVKSPTQTAAQIEAVQASAASYLIVQFASAIKAEQTDALRARGFEIKAYIPHNAYIVKAPRTQQATLLANRAKQYRWVGAYGAGLKVQPELAQLATNIADQKSIEGEDEVTIAFTTFTGEKGERFKTALAALNLKWPSDVIERFDGVTTGRVVATRAEVSKVVVALANLEGIEWIEQSEKPKIENDNAVKIIQAGPNSTDTPLFRNGLTGAGQILAIADSGLDADHAQFRLSADAAAQTLSFATTTTALVNGALPFQVTNPNNKILTYYLLGIGSLIDNTNNPNGGKTLDPNEQIGSTYRNAVAYDDSNGYHGTHVVSVALGRDYAADGTGAVPGIANRTRDDGAAPDARLVFQDVGHPSGQLNGLNVSQALIMQQAYSTGARIHSQSWGAGTNPTYNTQAGDDDEAMWRLRDLNIFFSAGNSGPNSATITKDTKNGILVARTGTPTNASDPESLISSSSHGPARDGRIKPDIAAPGLVRAANEFTGIPSSFAYQTTTTANDAAVNPSAPNNNRDFSNIGGTSFSSPLAAGGAILVRQYFTDGYYPTGARTAGNSFNPSNALIKAIVLNSGRNMTGNYTADNAPAAEKAPLPNSGQGWGRMTLDDPLYFPGDRRELKILADIWNGATASDATRPAPNPAITTGQTHTYQLTNVSTVEPLRISLVWVDPKGAIGASVALINDLNLEVTDPTGKVYRGNVNFASAYSQVAGSSAFDNRNPLEAVYIQYPNPGTYTVKVIGANVPGNGQFGVVAQPGNQMIDSNRQGYALLATGNFTAGAVPVLGFGETSVNGGVNADRFVGRNETVTAILNLNNPTIVDAANVNVQVRVAPASQVPANLVRINGQAAGQTATVNLGTVTGATSVQRGLQITLLNDASIQNGQTITFNVTMTPANGIATTTQFTILVGRRSVIYRTRFEPTADPGGNGIVVIPESDWTLRADNPNPAPAGEAFAGNWQLTTSRQASANGSTASLGDPSGVGTSYGVSTTARADGTHDDTRWWTKKIVLPGLNVDTTTDRVSNPSLVAQLAPVIESFDVDVSADFTGDTNQGSSIGDFTILRVRPYTNNAGITATTDTGFDSLAGVTNLMIADSTAASTTGFRHFGGSSFYQGTGIFTVDNSNANNSSVAFRLEMQFKRNSVAQTGDGVYFDNVVLRLGLNDPTVYTAPLATASATVNGASFASGGAAAGALVSSFGTGFPVGTNLNSPVTAFPLPTTLNGVSVRVNGVLAPLLYVGVGPQFGAAGAFQINYQLPFETTAGVAFVEVLNNGTAITSEFLTVQSALPGIFSATQDGKGQAIVLNQDNVRNAANRPEARGRVLQIYATGTGSQLLNSITRLPISLASGAPTPIPTSANDPLYVTAFTPTVTIGGVAATVEFSGLTPGFVGLWQLNVRIPANAPTGEVPLVISVDGRAGNQTTVAIN